MHAACLDSFDAYLARLGVATRVPTDGLVEVAATRRTLDRVELLLIERARAGGATWTEIGVALGVSRQAAHARHRPRVKPTDGDSPRPFA